MERLLVSNREEDLRRPGELPGRFFMNQDIEQKKNDASKARKSNLATDIDAAEEGPPRRLKELLSEALRNYEKQLFGGKEFKPTLPEYLKFLQIERELELEAELTREVIVTWVEPAEGSEER